MMIYFCLDLVFHKIYDLPSYLDGYNLIYEYKDEFYSLYDDFEIYYFNQKYYLKDRILGKILISNIKKIMSKGNYIYGFSKDGYFVLHKTYMEIYFTYSKINMKR